MDNETKCKCDSINAMFHELLQSAQVIQAYAWGCQERLKNNGVDQEEMIETLSIIYDHVVLIGDKINQFNE